MAASTVSAAPNFSIEGHVIAAGSRPMVSSCYRLQATLAEPVAGYSSGATYGVAAGYQALPVRGKGDAIFQSTFEACP